MPRVVHFEIHADAPGRAAKFYKTISNWKIVKCEGPEDYWLVTTEPDEQPGTNGDLMKRDKPANGESITA